MGTYPLTTQRIETVMAEAFRDAKIETRVVETVVTYTLTLTAEEAETVAAVLLKVGGSPTNSPRKHADAVFDALTRAGCPGWHSPTFKLAADRPGVHFDEYPEG